MKKLFFLTVVLFSNFSYAGGKAFFPGWLSTGGTNSNYYVTNISDSASTVKVTFYNHDGTVYDEASQSGQNFTLYGSYSGDPLSLNGAVVEPNKTLSIYVNSSLFLFGYGVIEWTSDSQKQVSLIAGGYNEYNSGNQFGRAQVDINNGKPF